MQRKAVAALTLTVRLLRPRPAAALPLNGQQRIKRRRRAMCERACLLAPCVAFGRLGERGERERERERGGEGNNFRRSFDAIPIKMAPGKEREGEREREQRGGGEIISRLTSTSTKTSNRCVTCSSPELFSGPSCSSPFPSLLGES